MDCSLRPAGFRQSALSIKLNVATFTQQTGLVSPFSFPVFLLYVSGFCELVDTVIVVVAFLL